jgi:hypothetical protein
MREADVAAASLLSVKELRSRTRLARNIHWFVLLVFGALTIGALPFYSVAVLTATSPGCHRAGPDGFFCQGPEGHVPLGGAFNPQGSSGGLSQWATVYWVIAVTLGFVAVLVFYRHRSISLGVQGRIWPAVAVGGGLFFLAVFGNRQGSRLPLPDAWIRGTGVILVLAIGLGILAVLERDRMFGAYTIAFVGIALLSVLYDDVNLFQRFGLGAPFNGSGAALPNLLLPGIFLLLGGLGFWVHGYRARMAA